MKSPACPKCESKNTCPFFYGYPVDVEKWKRDLDSGKIALGGDVLMPDDPKWFCNECKNEWGKRE